jgi:hypothetical protein
MFPLERGLRVAYAREMIQQSGWAQRARHAAEKKRGKEVHCTLTSNFAYFFSPIPHPKTAHAV